MAWQHPRFNSRVHRGRDGLRMVFRGASHVSIRASTGDATQLFCLRVVDASVSIRASTGDATTHGTTARSRIAFQFARPQGTRRGGDDLHGGGIGFQFARPQGTRRRRGNTSRRSASFNSRVHRGRDRLSSQHTRLRQMFQFARPQGTRPLPTP